MSNLNMLCLGANLLIERRRPLIRRHIEFRLEHLAAGFVLGKRSAPLASLRQQAHELAVRGFMPRVELEQALSVGGGGVKLTGSRGPVDELLESRNRQRAQTLAFQQLPLLEGRAPVEIEAPEKVAAIERNGRSELAGGKMAFKLPGVQVDDGSGVERKLLACDEQVGIDLPAQPVEGNAAGSRVPAPACAPATTARRVHPAPGGGPGRPGRPAAPRQDGSQGAGGDLRRRAQS